MKKDNIQGSTASPPDFSATQTSEGGTSPLRSVFRGKWIAWIVLLTSLAVTFFAWYLARGAVLERANDRFVFRVHTIESALRERLHACAFLLQSGAGLFAASEEVTRAEWRTYVTAFQIDQYYQGVQGLGFAKRILPVEKKAHIRQIREEGFPDYDIHPDGARPEYTSIIFLEPFDWRNQRAFGYDMFSEPTRKEAMVMARDTGSAALSGKVTLLQETEKDVQAGFLMYLPVYRNGEVAETPEQRREALTGYVYSPFRMNNFMQGLLKEKRGYVELQIFDGDEPLQEALLYSSGNMESLLSRSDHVHFASYQSTLEYAGRRWLLVFKSSPYFEGTIDAGQVNSILLLGIIISLLLFSVVLSLTKSRNRALSLADMTLDLEKANLGLRREIEERKQAAQDLEEAELRFKAIFNAALDGIMVADMQTKTCVMGNSAICDMLGYQPEELIRLSVEDMHPAESLPEVLQQFERQAKGEIRLTSDLPLQRKDGSVLYADVSGTSMVLAGRPLLVGVFHDVTERKQGEEKIRKLNDELEERVRARTQQLLETQKELEQHRAHLEQEVAQRTAILTEVQRIARLGNWEWDLINNTLNWSDEMYSIFGYAPQQIGASYEAFLNVVHPEDRQLVDDSVREALAGQQHTYSVEHRILQPDGTLRYVHGLGEVMQGEDGQPISMLGTMQDITERKQMETELRESELAYRTLSQNLPGIVYRVHLRESGRMQFYNDMPVQMTGYAADELTTGAVCSIDPLILNEDRPGVEAEVKRAMAEKRAFTVEYRLNHKDGGIRWLAEHGMSVYGTDDAPLYIDGVIFDITEQKQVEEQIRNLNEKLEDKVRERTKQLMDIQEELVRKEKLVMLGQVAGSVGHELRNPLGVMSNAVYFLQTVLPEDDESVKEYLGIIRDEIGRSEHIVDELLVAVRTQPPDFAVHGVAELVGQILRRCSVPAGVTVTLDIPETIPPVRVDGLQMQQVLRNLISNSVESMPTGGNLVIRALENRQEGTVCLSVQDSGSGMPPEVLARLFQPLFTTKARGIGLGLVVVKNLVEVNSGTIMVESAVGKGTTFTVVLPMDNPEGKRHA